MAKIKLVVSATIEETFSDFIIEPILNVGNAFECMERGHLSAKDFCVCNSSVALPTGDQSAFVRLIRISVLSFPCKIILEISAFLLYNLIRADLLDR